jgi:2-polyprenyl-3-methyl-5-hydroxy-6-metoxy-1,4-benzoquinol methylase
MKNLVSNRFSLNTDEPLRYPQLVEHTNLLKKKIQNDFTLVVNECPCGSGGANHDFIISEVDRYGLPLQTVLCNHCGALRMDPYLDQRSLSDFYTNYYQEVYRRSDKVSVYYDKQRPYGRKFYELANSYLKPGSNVLEFGCGAGGALAFFKSKGHQVYGVEFSKKLIDYGKSKGLDNLHYGALSGFKSVIGATKFDFIFSNHVFEHISNPHEYLRECISMLSQDGSIVCAIPDVYNIHKYIFPNSDLKLMLHIAHVYNYSFECLKEMASKFELEIERIYPNDQIVTATSVMPELWFRLFRRAAHPQVTEKTTQTFDYLDYFKKTEHNFVNKIDLVKGELPYDKKPSTFSLLKRRLKRIIKWRK